jgi:anti-sigma B factor antagonist
MEDALKIATHVLNGWLVVSVIGVLDLGTADEFCDRVARVTSNLARPHVVLEFSALESMDSAGLNAIVMIFKRLRRAGGALVLAAPGSRLSRMLEITGLDRRLAVFRDPQEAVYALSLSSASASRSAQSQDHR